jgi:hypothetical protein
MRIPQSRQARAASVAYPMSPGVATNSSMSARPRGRRRSRSVSMTSYGSLTRSLWVVTGAIPIGGFARREAPRSSSRNAPSGRSRGLAAPSRLALASVCDAVVRARPDGVLASRPGAGVSWEPTRATARAGNAVTGPRRRYGFSGPPGLRAACAGIPRTATGPRGRPGVRSW